MPSPKHWFPVDHDLPTTAKLHVMMDQLGDRFLLTWLWIMSKSDQSDNRVKFPEDCLNSVSKSLRQHPETVRKTIIQLVSSGWIIPEETNQNGWPTIFGTRNYKKYHRSSDLSTTRRGWHQPSPKDDKATPPILDLTNHPNPLPLKKEKEKEKKDIYILYISDFILSDSVKVTAKTEGLPDPEANLPPFHDYHVEQSTQHTQEEWEQVYLRQLRYLKTKPHLQAPHDDVPGEGERLFAEIQASLDEEFTIPPKETP